MSLLSQFFPSGGSSTVSDLGNGVPPDFSNGYYINLVVVGGGGGGGGLPSVGFTTAGTYCCSLRDSLLTGGGGSGRLIAYSCAAVTTNSQYSITVGGGGAVNSVGGNSCFGVLVAGGGGNGAGWASNGTAVPAGGDIETCSSNLGAGGGGRVGAAATSAGGWSGSRTYSSCNTTGLFIGRLCSVISEDGVCSYASPVVTGKCSGYGGRSISCGTLDGMDAYPLMFPLGITAVGKFATAAANDGTCYPTNSGYLGNWIGDLAATLSAVPGRECCLAINPFNTNTTLVCNTPVGGCSFANAPFFSTSGPANYTSLAVSCADTSSPSFTSPTNWPSSSLTVSNWRTINGACIVTGINTLSTMNGRQFLGDGGHGGFFINPATPKYGALNINGTTVITAGAPVGPLSTPRSFPFTDTAPYSLTFPGMCISGGSGGSGSVWVVYPTEFPEATVTGNTPFPSPPSVRIYKWEGAGTITFN